MASKPTAEGVIVLRGMILKEHAGTPSVQQRELSNEEERAALLAQVFGFDFSLRV